MTARHILTFAQSLDGGGVESAQLRLAADWLAAFPLPEQAATAGVSSTPTAMGVIHRPDHVNFILRCTRDPTPLQTMPTRHREPSSRT